jgi:hypothetical protein
MLLGHTWPQGVSLPTHTPNNASLVVLSAFGAISTRSDTTIATVFYSLGWSLIPPISLSIFPFCCLHRPRQHARPPCSNNLVCLSAAPIIPQHPSYPTLRAPRMPTTSPGREYQYLHRGPARALLTLLGVTALVPPIGPRRPACAWSPCTLSPSTSRPSSCALRPARPARLATAALAAIVGFCHGLGSPWRVWSSRHVRSPSARSRGWGEAIFVVPPLIVRMWVGGDVVEADRKLEEGGAGKVRTNTSSPGKEDRG